MSNDTRQALREFCNVCGWRKGGPDSWDGARCKCGHSGGLLLRLEKAGRFLHSSDGKMVFETSQIVDAIAHAPESTNDL